MKVVLDSNVIVAAFATQGLCHLVLENVVAMHELQVSSFLLGEVEDALVKKVGLPIARAKEVTGFVGRNGTVHKDSKAEEPRLRDPDDLKVLGLANVAEAEVIVTGDQDLLVLKSFGRVAILTPRAFWDMLRSMP